MYLSRIELDFARYETKRALSSPQVLHAGVESCRPHAAKEEARGLWRLDRLNGRLYLLLLSPETPDFTDFAKQFCPPGQRGETKPYDALLSRVQAGQEWKFRLRANPTHSTHDKGASERGKVFAHVTVEQQKEWLRKKSSANGFALSLGEREYEEYFDVIESDLLRFRRQSRYVTLGVATFEGVLRVTDAEAFVAALKNGIGRAKAYGCGLLTIAGFS